MITVAIIGILAAIAIPAFMMYQNRSRRSEAYTNLESIRKAQLAYAAEFGAFVSAAPSPLISLGPDKQNWPSEGDRIFSSTGAGTGFETLGWRPDGPTYFDYDTNQADDSTNGPSFTAAAYGDVDGDGGLSVFLYVQPDAADAVLPCWLCSGGVTPVLSFAGAPVDAYGNDVMRSVAALIPPDGDDF
jgi:type IV pilus assembly protein PilA